MSLSIQIQNLTTRISNECKSLRVLLNNNNPDLSALSTTVKTNLVAAINELYNSLNTATSNMVTIDDASTTSTSEVWSAAKIVSAITAAKNEILGGAGAAFDTLKELQDALGSDATLAATINTALANRVRFDAAQTLTAGEKLQACNNIGVGDPETDFVTVFNNGLV